MHTLALVNTAAMKMVHNSFYDFNISCIIHPHGTTGSKKNDHIRLKAQHPLGKPGITVIPIIHTSQAFPDLPQPSSQTLAKELLKDAFWRGVAEGEGSSLILSTPSRQDRYLGPALQPLNYSTQSKDLMSKCHLVLFFSGLYFQ